MQLYATTRIHTDTLVYKCVTKHITYLLQNYHKEKCKYKCNLLQVFAIELVTFSVDFISLAVEFGTFAVEFVGFAVEFVAIA